MNYLSFNGIVLYSLLVSINRDLNIFSDSFLDDLRDVLDLVFNSIIISVLFLNRYLYDLFYFFIFHVGNFIWNIPNV